MNTSGASINQVGSSYSSAGVYLHHKTLHSINFASQVTSNICRHHKYALICSHKFREGLAHFNTQRPESHTDNYHPFYDSDSPLKNGRFKTAKATTKKTHFLSNKVANEVNSLSIETAKEIEFLNLDSDPRTREFISEMDMNNMSITQVVNSTWSAIKLDTIDTTYLNLIVRSYLNDMDEEKYEYNMQMLDKMIAHAEFYPTDGSYTEHPRQLMTKSTITRVPDDFLLNVAEQYELAVYGVFDFSEFKLDDLKAMKDLLTKLKNKDMDFSTNMMFVFFTVMWMIGLILSYNNYKSFMYNYKNFKLTTNFKNICTTVFYQVINVYFTVSNSGAELLAVHYLPMEKKRMRMMLMVNAAMYILFSLSLCLIQLNQNIYTQLYNSMKTKFFITQKALILRNMTSEGATTNPDMANLIKLVGAGSFGYIDEKFALLRWESNLEIYISNIFTILLVVVLIADFIICYEYYNRIFIINKSLMLTYEGVYDSQGYAALPNENAFLLNSLSTVAKNGELKVKILGMRSKLSEIRQLITSKVNQLMIIKSLENQKKVNDAKAFEIDVWRAQKEIEAQNNRKLALKSAS